MIRNSREINENRLRSMLLVPVADDSVGIEIAVDDDSTVCRRMWSRGFGGRFDSMQPIDLSDEAACPDTNADNGDVICHVSASVIHGSPEPLDMDRLCRFAELASMSGTSVAAGVQNIRDSMSTWTVGDVALKPVPNADALRQYREPNPTESCTSDWKLRLSLELLSGDWIVLSVYFIQSNSTRLSLLRLNGEGAVKEMADIIEDIVDMVSGCSGKNATVQSLCGSLSYADVYKSSEFIVWAGVTMSRISCFSLPGVGEIGMEGMLDEIEQKTRSSAGGAVVSLVQEAEESGRPVRRCWRLASA